MNYQSEPTNMRPYICIKYATIEYFASAEIIMFFAMFITAWNIPLFLASQQPNYTFILSLHY